VEEEGKEEKRREERRENMRIQDTASRVTDKLVNG
jgi:hypothetical protein